MEALQLFVPMDRRRALGLGERLPERTSGAVLFADISGFSALTAALARDLGPQRGAEDLTRHLDRVVGALTAAVHRYHGSVIGFSGDGVTCWFDEDALGADACVAAGACALAMQEVVDGLPPIGTPGGESVALGIKVALAAGPVRRLLVGDAYKLEVLAGATLNRMAEAANSAARGQVVASREVVECLDARAIATIWHPSPARPHLAVIQRLGTTVREAPWDALPDLVDDATRAWVPEAVYQRLRLGRGEFVAELRPVVSMFLRFTGIDYDGDEGGGRKLDAYVRWVQATVEGYGGNLLQISVDDKGCYLYVVVGALQAYGDAAQRAVAAACHLRTLPPDLDFVRDSQIGLSRGRAYVGAYGGDEHCVYSVIGQEVNVAARLMQRAAPDEILISHRIRDEVRRSFDLEDRGDVELSGIPGRSHVFAVVGGRHAATPVPDAPAPLVGRDAQRQELAQRLSALLTGRGASVLIEGPAGIGKSRLVADFVEGARREAVRLCIGSADAIERSAAYHVWRGVFSDVFDLGTPADPARAAEDRLAELDTGLAHLAPLLGAVLPAAPLDSPRTAEMTGKVRADNTNDLLVAILRAVARHAPIVLVLEDVHWMDSASWALLKRVRHEVAPLLLVLSARPTSEPADEYMDLLSGPDAHHLRLDALSRPATEALLRQRLGVDAVPEPLLDLIFRKSDGHPFFSEVIAHALLEAGVVQIHGRSCYLSPGTTLEAFDTPDTIEGVIIDRIDSLVAAEQLTLKVASVIGRVFGFGILRDVHPVERDAESLGAHLDHLTRIEMLLAAPDAFSEYLFKHVITQEVAYGLLLYRQRRELHRGVARWYEEHAGPELSAHYARLAHHWSRAARDEAVDPDALRKALDYLEKAGEQALNSYANEEAVRFFSEALELQGSTQHGATARAARWHHRLSLAHQGLGDLGRCREHAQRGLALLGRPMPSGSLRLLGGTLAQVARRMAGRLIPRRAPGDTARQQADLYIPLARVAYHTNDSLGSLYVNTKKLNLMERLGPSPELAESYGSIGISLGVFQLHGRADSYLRRAVEVARLTNNGRGLVTALVITSAYQIGMGQWRRVQEHLEEGRAICERLGDHQQWGDCVAIMADASVLEGDLPRAMRLYEELLTGARHRNNHLQELWAIRGKATEALRNGRAEDAVRLLEHAVVLLEDTTDHPTRIDMHGLLALARLARNDLTAAERSAREAAALIAKTSPPTVYPQYLGYAAVAETFLALLRVGGAVADVKRALRNLHTYRRIFPIGRPQAWRHQGSYEELRGNRRKARRSWEKGLASATALGIPYEQDMLRRLLAR
jgi:class 3 adenylate cyclase/tetratricopeptide (TPR) repeat protein